MALTSLCVLMADGADAEPSVWASAAAPKVHVAFEVTRKADAAISEHYVLRRSGLVFQSTQALRKARRILERAKAAISRDPALRYRLGSTYYMLFDTESDRRLLEKARDHLRFVVDHPNTTRSLRSEALNDLAIVYAKLSSHAIETVTYTRALAIEPHAETRAVLLANRAEGFMVQGDILRAVRGYRESLAVTPSAVAFRLTVTTRWGLAVALDRTGNLDGALERIRQARTYDPIDRAIQSSSWFYVPSYDDRWYRALGHWSHARDAKDAAAKAAELKKAVVLWQQYIALAPDTDHWRALAARRLHQCERERTKIMAGTKAR